MEVQWWEGRSARLQVENEMTTVGGACQILKSFFSGESTFLTFC
jgi:uncharacterized protein (AIM24 family)